MNDVNKPINTKKPYDNTKTKRLENSFKMLELLKKNGTMKAYEISKELGLNNTRQIYHYKRTLIYLGYNIVSYGGYMGGYEYIKKEKLTNDELEYLSELLPVNKNDLFEKIKRINENL
jgi:cytoplasmic iron level regulating protein YaaA (DUF328/UPF0246 family)